MPPWVEFDLFMICLRVLFDLVLILCGLVSTRKDGNWDLLHATKTKYTNCCVLSTILTIS